MYKQKQGQISILTTFVKYSTKGPTSGIREEKEIKGMKIRHKTVFTLGDIII